MENVWKPCFYLGDSGPHRSPLRALDAEDLRFAGPAPSTGSHVGGRLLRELVRAVSGPASRMAPDGQGTTWVCCEVLRHVTRPLHCYGTRIRFLSVLLRYSHPLLTVLLRYSHPLLTALLRCSHPLLDSIVTTLTPVYSPLLPASAERTE